MQQVVAQAAVTRACIDRDYVLAGLKENFERAMQYKPVLDGKGKPTGEYAYSGAVANRALELLGKDLGMFSNEGADSSDQIDLKAVRAGFLSYVWAPGQTGGHPVVSARRR